LKSDPRDARALEQLGEEELALGDTSAACAAFRVAGIAARMSLCEQMQQFDPTQRGLTPAERHRRSQALAAAVESELQSCSGAVPAATRSPRSTDANLALAADLWAKRLATCPAPPLPDAALTRVMRMMKH
jgi:hypothetical protein